MDKNVPANAGDLGSMAAVQTWVEKNFQTQSISERSEFVKKKRAEMMRALQEQWVNFMTDQGESMLFMG